MEGGKRTLTSEFDGQCHYVGRRLANDFRRLTYRVTDIRSYDLMDKFYKYINLQEPASKSTLYHFVAHFFAQIGVAMKRLQGRCTVGIIHGEISSVMEKNRYNALDRGQGFPDLYNQILMSNIPSVPS